MRRSMFNRTSRCLGALLAGLLAANTATRPAIAAENGPPNFSPSGKVGWIAGGGEFLPPASGPGPVMDDPAHPRVGNNQAARTGRQPTFHIGDAESPILQPWAKDVLRKRKEMILAGMPGDSRQVSCWPLGVPGFLLYAAQPIYIIQTPKQVLLIAQNDQMVRRIYLDVQHSPNPKPSWFGESVGHYEGDTL